MRDVLEAIRFFSEAEYNSQWKRVCLDQSNFSDLQNFEERKMWKKNLNDRISKNNLESGDPVNSKST
jgi:hypothetical protein